MYSQGQLHYGNVIALNEKNFMRTYLTTIILCLLLSCNRQPAQPTYPPISQRAISIDYKNFELPFDTARIKSLYAAQCLDSFAYFLNTEGKEILVYNIAAKSFSKSIPLYDSLFYRDSIGELSSFYAYNIDSIFILQEFRITLINNKGALLSSWKINTDTLSPYYYKLSTNFPIFYSASHNSLFIQQISMVTGGDSRQKFSCGVEAEFNLTSKRVDTLPMNYPTMYRTNFYGFADEVSRCINGNTFVYSFMLDPNIYTLNTTNGITSIKPGKSRLQSSTPAAIPLNNKDSSQIKMEQMQQYPIYTNILYDSYRQLYYRFFYKDQQMQNPDGTYNAWADKDFVLMVFDQEFNLIKEEVLEKNTYGTLAFITPEGLCISRLHYKNPLREVRSIIPLTLIHINEK